MRSSLDTDVHAAQASAKQDTSSAQRDRTAEQASRAAMETKKPKQTVAVWAFRSALKLVSAKRAETMEREVTTAAGQATEKDSKEKKAKKGPSS